MRTTEPDHVPSAGTAELLADPYATYARLRQAGPVHRIIGPDGLPAWLVTRYEDVRQALADPRLSLDKRHALPGHYRGFALPPALDANLLNMDPPGHTRIRRLAAKAFTPRRVAVLREPIQQVADDLLDAIAPQGRADLIASYAAPLSISVICDLLGVPKEGRTDFRVWTDALLTPDPAQPTGAAQAVAAMVNFLGTLIARKRAEPTDDFLSDLIAARDEGAQLTEDELTSLAFLLLFAGYENTIHLIGNGVLAILDRPDQLQALRADPSRFPHAVEEFARYDSPAALAIRRFPISDTPIGNVTIPAGQTVLLSLVSANRDPDRFPHPDRLDIDRRESGHAALGHGIHYCLGAPLARLEVEIALARLLDRFPRLELDVPYRELSWRPSIRVRGLIALPVRYGVS
jgi:cytochrome P450